MNDKYKKLYQYLSSNGMTDLDENQFFSEYSSNPQKIAKLHSYLTENKMTDLDANAFQSSYFGVKKKEVSQSTLDQGNTSSGRLSNTTTKPTASSSSPEILTDYLGKSKKKYKFEDNQWYEENPKPQVAKSTPSKFGGTAKTYGEELKFNPNAAQGSWKPIEEESRVKALNYYYKKEGSLATEQKVFTNYDPEKKDNFYRIENGQWERKVPKGSFVPVNDEIATQALNKRYGQNVVFTPTDTPVVKKKEDPKFMDINSNLTAKTEEDAIGYLEENYGKYGFEFNQEGLFLMDQIRVRTKDGKKEEVFEFDQKDPKEADRLRAFLEENKTKAYSGTYNYLDEKVRNQSKDIPKGEGRSQQEIQDYLKAVQLKKGEYILSDDYLNNFKKLDADEMKDQITNVIGKSGLNSKTIQEFYKTDAYKAYKTKKADANKSDQEKINDLYDQSKYAKLAGDKAGIKDAQNRIDAYLTNDVIADNVKNYDMQLNDLKNRNKQLEAEYSDYEKQVNKFNSDKTIIDQKVKSGEISREQYNGMIDGLNQRSDELNNLSENIQTKAQKIKLETDNVSTSQKKLNYVAGKYVAAKEKEGGAIGFAVNSILNGVSGAFIEPFANYAVLGNQYEDLSPEEKQYYKDKKYTKDQVENILDNKAILKAKNEAKQMLISSVGFEETTQEYMKSGDRGFIATALGGVLQSLPAMATGVLGKAASFTGLAAQAYSGIEEEMLNDPDFQTTSVGERSIIAIPYAIGMGILENAGLTNMIKGNSVTGKALQGLVTRTIASAPKGATQDFLNKLVAKEIESNLAKGVIKITQAGLAEFETGATQSLVLDQGLKQIYNVVAQRNMTADEKKNLSKGEFFDTADSFGELATQTFEDGLAEMIGGVTLGAVGTLSQRILEGNVSIYNSDDVEFLKNVAQDDNFKKLFVSNLKTSMLNGSMTKGQAQEKLDALNEIQAVFTKLPENISKDQVKQSMDLVVEKTKLEKEIAGKDPALVAAQTERINAINDELKTISQNAVQKQTTSEVPVQPGAKVGGEVAKGESKAGPEVATQESQKVEVGGTIRGHQTISGEEAIGDVREKLPNQNNGTVVLEGEDGGQYAVAFSRKGADGKNIFEQGTTTPRPGYISASVKIAENATPEQVQAAQQEAQRNLEVIIPTVVGGVINAQAVNDVMVQQAPISKMETTAETEQVATYRAEEQAELIKAIPKIESYKVNGEIDKTLMPKTVLAKYNKIYDKYDKLISPLLEAKPTTTTDNQLTERNVRTMSVKYKRNPIVRAATNVLKALPGVKVYLHEDTDQYSNAIANKTGENKQSIQSEESAGSYIDGEIHLDMSLANTVTLLHEAVHHALMVNGIKGKYIIDMAKGLRGIIKDKARLAELDAFVSQYEEETDQETLETRSDEFMAQLGGILAANQEELTTSGLTKFMALINKIFKKLGFGNVFTKASTAQDAVNFINAVTRGLNVGEDVSDLFDPGDGGEVGTFNIPKTKFQKAKSVAEDPRDFIRELVEEADLREFNGQKFITNMYDYTNAGETDLGNGFKINLLGGKNYVPLMMSLNGKKLGEVSNLAAFNTKAQAETFIRNADKSGAELFAPHSGTLGQSWQFQQHTFAELFNLVLDRGILTSNELIDVFNNTIKNSAANQANFEVFAKKYGENIENFDSFESDPKKIIDLLDIKNNYSPKLRKALNNAIASNKSFQKAIGVNNKDEFYKKIMDPLNQGMTGGEIMNVVKFDPNTFEIVQTKESDTDHHPSFGWTLLAKINGIYQPTDLYKSSDVTESYTKYNKKGEEVSRKAEEPKFEQKNVSSSAGAIPKVAELDINKKRKKQLTQNWVETPVKSMMNSPIAKNSDNLRSVAVDLVKGKINQGEYVDAVKKYSPIGSIGTLFAPSTMEHMIKALGKKADKLMAPVVDELGKKIKRVGLRLDIPSYLHNNAWIVTIHDGRVKNGNVVSYRNAARLKNVEFATDPRIAINIAAGFNPKGTFARMVGDMVDIPGETAEEQGLNAQAMVEEIMNDPNWVQVGMNPFRHSFFWNRATGAPVVSADEVIQIGGLVYAKNVKEASPNSDEFTVYGKYDESKNKVVASDEPLLDKSGKKIKFQKQAPNGQSSNLNDKQWEQVRTPAFKKWFGDWENDPKNASKVVDENGEPLMTYHGSEGGFDEFKTEYLGGATGADITKMGFFFTNNENVAKTFQFISQEPNIDELTKIVSSMSYDEMVEFNDAVMKTRHFREGGEITSEDDESYEDFLKDIENDSQPSNSYDSFGYMGKVVDFLKSKGIEFNPYVGGEMYKVFLNIRNPFEIDANGDLLDNSEEISYDENKYDGVIVRNTLDSIPLSERDGGIESDVFITKNPKAIKSATENVGTFSAETPKIKFQKAPKILGQKPTVVIVNDEAKALIDQIKLEVRAQREQKKAQTEVRKSISDSVKAMVKKGSINLKQASTIISTLNRVNLDNPEMVKRFNDYIAKVFDRAEYIDKIERATSMKRKIKQNLKGASNPFAIAAKGFSQLEPKWVENIDEYIAIAQAVYDSVRKSTARKGVINWKQEADFQTIAQYVFDEEARQTEVLLGNLRSLYERITGKSSDTIGADVMQAELKDLNIPEDFSADVLDQIEEKLAEFEQMVEDTDPEVVQKAASIDPTIIPTKEAIRILDALDTYFMNGSTAGLNNLMDLYTGKENAIKFKYKARPLRAFGSEYFAQKKFQSIVQFNMILERKFGTKEAALAYKKASGIQDIENGANKAEAQAMKKQKEYMTKFGKIKGFSSAENIFQRGALANLLRTMVASEEMQQAEFDRNIEILRNSVDTLNKGNSNDKKKAKVYKKVLTELGVFNPNVDIEMVLKNAKQENINAVNFVIDMFGEIVDPLSDLALGMYNQILTQDVNYTPYVYKMTELAGKYGSSDYGGVDKDGKPKLNFFGTSTYANQSFDKNKAGILMPITRPKELRAGMHIDLDFDNNMFRQYRNALVDLYTAGPIRQLEGFFGSEQNKKILGSNEDQDIIYSALVDYIRTKKGTNFVTDDGLKFLNKISDYMAQFGAARALVGFGQFVNQFASGMTNTIINAGEYIRPGDFSKEIFEFIANSGRAIANVGGDEILVVMGDIDKSIERADLDNRPDQYVLKFIAKENMRLFNVMVAYPDAVARKLAWMAYYRKSMVEQGLLGYTEAIDTTKINDTAADYAQLMVDRNMDATDAALRGSLFRNRNSAVKILRSIFLPFSSFGLNQKNRMWNDLNAIASGRDIVTSGRSIASIGAELVVYNAIRYYVAKTILGAALSLLGYDDDDQEELYNKLLNNARLSSWSKLFTDIISPIPLLDNQTLELANKAMKGSSLFAADPEAVQKYVDKLKAKGNLTDEEIEKKKLAFEDKNSRSFFIDTEANKGSLSIQYEKAAELMDLVNAWRTGEFIDDNKNERFLSKDSQEKLTAPLMMKFVATVYGTRELDQIANKSFKIIKDAESMSSTQQDNYKEVKKELGRDLTEFERGIVKEKRTVETALQIIKFVEKNGGLNKEKGSEYLKLLDIYPKPGRKMLIDIQNGQKAKDIIKRNTE